MTASHPVGRSHLRLRGWAGLGAVPVLVAALLAVATPAAALTGGPDTGGYTYLDSSEPGGPAGGPFPDISSTGTDIGNHYDDATTPVRLPFPVSFYGVSRSAVLVSTNGNLQFETNDPEYHEVFPESYGPAIVAFQTDLRTDLNGLGIYTQVLGTAPTRQFVVQWSTAAFDTSAPEVFQVVFTEASPQVVVRYLDVDRTPGVGVQGAANGADGMALAYGASVSDGLAVAFTTSVNTHTAVTAKPTAATFGQAVTFTATVTRGDDPANVPTGTVQFFLNGSATPLGSASVKSNGLATFATSSLPSGADTVRAAYGGDAVATASSGSTGIVVSPAATTTVLKPVSGATVSFGSAVTASVATAKPGGGTPSGYVDWYDGGTFVVSTALRSGTTALPVGSLDVGTHQLRAVYSSNTVDRSGSEASSTLSVTPAATSTVLAVSPKSPTPGQRVTLTATVKDSVSAYTPTGTVDFLDGSTVIASPTLTSRAQATYVITALAPGTHTFSAVYRGDARFANSSS